jgi:hypothetical protein
VLAYSSITTLVRYATLRDAPRLERCRARSLRAHFAAAPHLLRARLLERFLWAN